MVWIMDLHFVKFTEIRVDENGEDYTNELMLDQSLIIAIRGTYYGTEIITTEGNYSVINSFDTVRDILDI